ncbi:MAG: hypothetical protein M3548_06105, partial [Actinomycetota bacterium]|nr:hypothetical protein [Actinomycetota bacterium]
MIKTSELGLDDAAESVYRVMLSRSRWRLSELVVELGWDVAKIREIVSELRTQGFLLGSADDSAAIRAVEPQLARRRLAARKLE